MPIIVISARDRESEKVEALDLGADDFVTKPFSVGELIARIRAALRNRIALRSEPVVVRVADVEIDNVRHRVKRAGKEVRLTSKEFELLAFLAQHAGAVVAHGHILTAIWGPAHAADVPYLRLPIGRLRRKIEDDPDDPKIVLTEPGIGYRTGSDRRAIRFRSAARIGAINSPTHCSCRTCARPASKPIYS